MDRVEVGYVARAHGVRGELRVHLHDAGSTVIYDVDEIWIGGAACKVASVRPTVGAALVSVDGIEDRTAAERLKGRPVEVSRAAIPLAPGEYLVGDLPGCAVVDAAGTPLGVVVEVLPSAQDIMVIRDDRFERLLPIVPEFIRAVDVAARRVVVELPEDLPAEPLPGKGSP